MGRDAAIAINLRGHRSQNRTEEEEDTPVERLTVDQMAEVIIGPVSTNNERKQPAPTRHEAPIRKEEKEGDEAGLPKDIEDAEQPESKARLHCQRILKGGGKRGATKEDQREGAEEGHPVIRAPPEDDGGNHTVDQDDSRIPCCLKICQESQRQARLAE